jgi:hypothetical protein
MPFSVEFERPVCERMTPMNTSLGRTKKRSQSAHFLRLPGRWSVQASRVSRSGRCCAFRRCCCYRAVAMPNCCACQQRWSLPLTTIPPNCLLQIAECLRNHAAHGRRHCSTRPPCWRNSALAQAHFLLIPFALTGLPPPSTDGSSPPAASNPEVDQ